jgi:hypothetical protein
MENEIVTLTIGKAEALMLFELLGDFRSQTELHVKDHAERVSLRVLQCALEKTLVEPFSKDYPAIFARARDHLIRQWGDGSEG